MEKTKNIPGWYQRLISLQTKPVSQTTFKQYCQENEVRMRILYPFLPAEQIKGKLLVQWKRRQTPAPKQPKKQQTPLKFKFPVINFTSKLDANTKALPTEKTKLSVADWLNGANKTGDKDKTYKGRTFKLPTIVPEVISQSSNHEKSILKNRRGETASSSREKRQPASRVSFTPYDQQTNSPLLYSPPSPFVLSPVTDEEQIENNSLHTHKPVRQSTKTTDKKVKQLHDPCQPQLIQTRNEKKGQVENNSTLSLSKKTKPTKNSFQKKNGLPRQVAQSKRSPRSLSQKKKKNKEKGIRRKSPGHTKNLYSSLTPSQHLEPPKFGSPESETPNQEDKRFCLFEDEWVNQKPIRNKLTDRSKKPPRRKTGKKLFSWSPAFACSQHTPKLRKSEKSLFSQEKPETYHKQKKNVSTGKAKQKSIKGKSSESKKTRTNTDFDSMSKFTPKHKISTSLKPVAGSGGSRRGKSPQRNKTKENENQDDSTQGTPPECNQRSLDLSLENVSKNKSLENKTRFTKDISKASARTVTSKLSNKKSKNAKETQNMCQRKQKSTGGKISNTNLSPKSKISKSFQQSDQELPHPNSKCQRLRKSDDQKENLVTLHQQTENELETNVKKDTTVSYISPLKENKIARAQRNLGGHDKDVLCPTTSPVPSPSDRFYQDLDNEADSEHSPLPTEETNVLWQILFQLKSTAAASQEQNNLPSSPAQSRITEISEMSGKSPSSYAPSPVMQTNLRDEMDLFVAEEFPVTKSLTSHKRCRKRSNILCNMFDASTSAKTAVPEKIQRRYIPSETCPQERDFSTLFDADTFI